jgi:hypothetical protein
VHRQAGREVAPALRQRRRPLRRAPKGGPLGIRSLRRYRHWPSARRHRPARARGRALLTLRRAGGARATRRRAREAGLCAPAQGRRRRGPPHRPPREVRRLLIRRFLFPANDALLGPFQDR